MKAKKRNRKEGGTFGIRGKLIFSLSAIGLVLLISSFITFFEYRSISHHVSELIADNIHSITLVEKISDETSAYNTELGRVLGTRSGGEMPVLDIESIDAWCDTLTTLARTDAIRSGVEELRNSLEIYVRESTAINTTSIGFNNVFTGGTGLGDWFYDEFQDKSYRNLRRSLTNLSTEIYTTLELNAERFDNGFYRSIIPEVVAVATGLLLILVLLAFMLSYYVNPLRKMLASLREYRSEGRKYSYEFDGDDELAALNDGIREVCGENQQLRRRITTLKEQKTEEAAQ